MKKLLAVSGLALAVSTAQAVEQPYIGVAISQPTFSDDGGGDASPTVAQLRFGTNFSKRLGMQATVSVNAGDAELTKSGAAYDFTVDSMYTLASTLRLPLGEKAALYGQLGYSYAQLTASNATFTSEDNLDGLTYGVGVVFPVFSGLLLDVDYTSYLNGADTLGGLGIGVRKPL
jgi:hypothetical protein